ncbi:MAG TPA: FtsX-like permease family protein [Alphaproteobacteria bacterium]|nr:FtsX-like permease family protein [Alphaproteobacteria bacterium]
MIAGDPRPPGWGLAAAFARRELRGGLKGFRVFLACLALGVATIAGVGSLAEGVDAALMADARVLLGGDVELSFTHREASDEQRRHLGARGEVSTIAEMRAMARGETHRVLVELKAVDGRYPLVGEVVLEGGGSLAGALERRDGVWGAAAERATLSRLGLTVGDTLAVGEERYAIRAVIVAEPDRSANVFTLGPRLMVALASLPETGLLQPGSLVRYEYRVRLPPGVAANDWIAELRQRFPAAGWRIRSLNEAAPGVQRWIDRIAFFLSLVGLTALLVGGVGVANAVRSYLEGKTNTIATLKCLGAPARFVRRVYLLQIAALAGLGIALGLLVGALAPILVAPLLQGQLPVAARIGLYPVPLIKATALGFLTALAFSLWPLARARAVPPAALFRDRVAHARTAPRLVDVAAIVVVVIALAMLTIETAVDRRLAINFVIAAAASFALFRIAGAAIAVLARRIRGIRRPGLRMALANMHRPGSATPAIVLSLGLGLTVLITVALVQGNLVRQLREQIPEIAPTFFFIDLQSDQVAEFDALVGRMPGVGEVRRVPSLRGRIVKIDGEPVERVAVAPEAQWAIGSDRGLTYSARPPADSRVVAGRWWPPDYSGPPLVSFDAQLARGMGLEVGDRITINVLGRDIEAQIANLRAIDWTSLGINFTLVFAPGALEAAPHTHIATAQVAAGYEDSVERAVTDRFANVSAIRIKDALATVDRMLANIAVAARATAALTLAAGILVLAGAVIATQRRRNYDAVVLKVLGARRRDVLAAFLIEFGLIGAATSLVATIAGSFAAWFLMGRYLRAEFVFLPRTVIGVAIAATAAIMVLGLAGTWRALSQKAAPLLRNE